MNIGNEKLKKKKEKEMFKIYKSSVENKREEVKNKLFKIVEKMNYEELLEFEKMLDDEGIV